MDDDDEDHELLMAQKHFRSDGVFRWKSRGQYGRMQELDDAGYALGALGINFEELQLFPSDPPDCIARIDGRLWAIEVTELIHPQTMERRRKIIAEAAQTTESRRPLSLPHHEWTDDEAIHAIQHIIAGKDKKTYLGGPYDRILVVVRTEEMHLDLPRITALVQEFEAPCSQITDACVAFGYHPGAGNPSQEYPAVRVSVFTS